VGPQEIKQLQMHVAAFFISSYKKNGIIILSKMSAFHPDSNKIDKLYFSLLKTLGEQNYVFLFNQTQDPSPMD
jgi:hypothetical protein